MQKTMTIKTHGEGRDSKKRIRYHEIPQQDHDKLVREYWKTWLAALRLRCTEDAFLVFVGEMEHRLYEAAESGLFTSVDGIEDE